MQVFTPYPFLLIYYKEKAIVIISLGKNSHQNTHLVLKIDGILDSDHNWRIWMAGGGGGWQEAQSLRLRRLITFVPVE